MDAWGFVDVFHQVPNDISAVYVTASTKFVWWLDYQRVDFLVWAERFGFFSAEGHNSTLDTPATRAQEMKETLDSICFVRSLLENDELARGYEVELHGTGGQSIRRTSKGRYTRLRDAAG